MYNTFPVFARLALQDPPEVTQAEKDLEPAKPRPPEAPDLVSLVPEKLERIGTL